MIAMSERAILGQIEFYEVFGERTKAKALKEEFDSNKRIAKLKKSQNTQKNQSFEGTIVAAGWDKHDHVDQSSLFTREEEDILLDHGLGINKFKPFFNQKVRILGDITTNSKAERRINVKKITRIISDFTKPLLRKRDEFGNILSAVA